MSQERTGSNLLQHLLHSHDQILTFGEIFNPTERVRRNSWAPKPLKVGQDPLEYLENSIYKAYPARIKAVGFRLFYTQAWDEWNEIWEYLRDSKVKIIHLKRRNLLDRHLSHQLARRSKQYKYFEEGGMHYEPIRLAPKECFQDFHRSLWHYEKREQFFKDNPMIEVIYEDLCNDLGGQCHTIQKFLGVAPQQLSTRTRKQRVQKKPEIIENYANLRSILTDALATGKSWAKAEWLEFFDDK